MYDLIVGDFSTCAFQAHSDLLEFNELGKLWDFDTWLAPMRNKMEEGISVITYTYTPLLPTCMLHAHTE